MKSYARVAVKQFLILSIYFGIATLAHATGNPPFTAVCTDVVTHGYRDGTDITGQRMEDAWSTDEKFNLSWSFKYDGDEQIIIDGNRGHVLAQHPGVLIASEAPASNGIGAGVWVYAIHVGMGEVVASQVNAHGGFERESRGVKARSTEFDCSFDTD